MFRGCHLSLLPTHGYIQVCGVSCTHVVSSNTDAMFVRATGAGARKPLLLVEAPAQDTNYPHSMQEASGVLGVTQQARKQALAACHDPLCMQMLHANVASKVVSAGYACSGTTAFDGPLPSTRQDTFLQVMQQSK